MERKQLRKKDVCRYPLNLETFFIIHLWLLRNTEISTGLTLRYSVRYIIHERWILLFLGVIYRPRVFPPPHPGDRFSAQTTKNRHCNWAYPMGSTVKSSNALSSPTKFPHFCSACTVKSLLFRSYFVVLSESPSSLFSLDKDCSLNVPLRSLIIICKRLSKMALVRAKKGLRQEYVMAREDKGDREGIPPTHLIPWIIRLELFLESW